MPDSVTLRCFVDHKKTRKPTYESSNASSSLVLVLDTETRVDEAQTLLFGSCMIYSNKKLVGRYLFRGDYLRPEEIEIIDRFGLENNWLVVSRQYFVDNIFYQYVYRARAKCIGFNLPFDLTRLGIRFAESRKYLNGFSVQLSSDRRNPRIVINSLNTKAAFIEFTHPIRKKSEKKRPHYRGYFVDLKTATFALTNHSYTLAKALEDFECDLCKLHPDKHGTLTEEYIKYNITDTESTHELYLNVLKRYSLYQLDKEINQLYSPASIGKAYLDKIGIRPFFAKNPEFPKAVLGHLMTAYYGGRTEVRYRLRPTLATYLDFTSMYPTVYSLLKMDAILKAKRINITKTTEGTQSFLDSLTLDDIGKTSTWTDSRMLTLCKIAPDNDILPIRSLYGSRNAFTIGVNHVKSEDRTALWYALPDLIASKLLSGKTPKVIEAITFQADGVQEGLREITLLQSVRVSPNEDFIKKLIDERLRIKGKSRGLQGEAAKQAKLQQMILKIIANSTSYGIFIEVNSEPKPEQVTVFGLETFESVVSRTELEGKAYNPIIATFVTSVARLIIASAEAKLALRNSALLYCDTDSIFIAPEHVPMIQAFFKNLNPYASDDTEMFKIEDYEDVTSGQKLPFDKVLFYGISSKRYVLYRVDKDGNIVILKHSSHGLGHILGVNEQEWWKDILTLHYHPEVKQNITRKYHNRHVISRLSVTNYETFSRFEAFNARKGFNKQIKPFNFVIAGTSYRTDDQGRAIVPMLPYIPDKIEGKQNTRFLDIPYRPFIDYKTGNKYDKDTEYYWLPLDEMFDDYRKHPESKFKGNTGLLSRSHLSISQLSIRYIGKETNELEESEATGADIKNYNHYSNSISLIYKHRKLLHSLRPRDAARFGIISETWKSVINHLDNNTLQALPRKTIAKLVRLVHGQAAPPQDPGG